MSPITVCPKTSIFKDESQLQPASESELLRDNADHYQQLIEAVPLGIALMDGAGNYKYFNPRFIEMFGYTLKEIDSGRDWFELAYPDEETRRHVIATWIMDRLKNGVGSHTRTFEVTCRDGSKKLINFKTVILKTGDILVLYEDMTETRRLELQLQQAQKMEAIGTLAGGIAHDFNNILMGVQGRVSLMLAEIHNDHLHYDHLRSIETYVRSASDLTRQLLGFARGGKYELKATDVNELIDQSAQLFGRTKKEIRIIKDFQAHLWPAKVDRRQMEQVLLNLYVNALQAMPNGGEMRLRTRNVVLGQADVQPHQLPEGRYIEIAVSDSGTGIDPNTLKRIFEPFFTTKGMGRGTGLGLASAYGIIKNHHGMISAASNASKGATFTIYLPVTDEKVQFNALPEQGIVKGSGNILLVDDEKMMLDVIGSMLERLGYTVLRSHSGRQAVELFSKRQEEIELVILDMIMPDMGGGEVFDRIKALKGDAAVLLSSGYSIDGQAQQIIDRGCRGFIQKPFDLNELSQQIRKIFPAGVARQSNQ